MGLGRSRGETAVTSRSCIRRKRELTPQERPADSAQLQHFGIRDLFDPDSVLHSTVIAESSYVLSAKSLCLVARANR